MTGTDYAVRGTLSEGMFPSEVVITFSDHAGQRITLVAPRSLVKMAGNFAFVSVRVIDSKDELFLIQLPGDVYGPAFGREVTVKKDLLKVG